MAKHFDAVRIDKQSSPVPTASGEPVLVAVNHPAWWDLMLGFALTDLLPGYSNYFPIEEAMLAKYKMFRRMGAFGVGPGSKGAADFLKTSRAIFSGSHSCMWVTVQGRFADPRERPVVLKPGVGHLAAGLGRGWLIPVAIEYLFWNERTPEALLRIGEPMPLGSVRTAREWNADLSAALTANMDALALNSMTRDPLRFETFIRGKRGVGGMGERLGRLKARVLGRKYEAGHRE